jgi:hypothetical protein
MRPGTLLAHLGAFAVLVVVTFFVFLTTADDDSWYPRPNDGDVGDDDGYFIATIEVMLFVVPMELVGYLTALWVARRA